MCFQLTKLISLEHLVVLFAGKSSHTGAQYIDYVKISTFYWICLQFIFLILVGVELPMCSCHSVLECSNLFTGVKLSIIPHSRQKLSCLKSGVDYS